ncbi:hypothetical protein U1Q18_052490 [Sarracenia purpurea var. burkii]
MEAKLGYQPYFVWRSLLLGREILERGMIWRVAKGDNIKIYSDRWIPRQKSLKIFSPPILGREKLVKELLQDDLQWDERKIRENFLLEDADAILALPICANERNDQLIWFHTKDGKYTVKTGYWLAREMEEENSNRRIDYGQSSQQTGNWWTGLWNLVIPPKIKIFLWRAYKNALPTSARLSSKNIPMQPTCRRCGDAEETIEHLLMSCKKTVELWTKANLRCLLKLRRGMFHNWTREIILTKDMKTSGWFAIIAWTIWNERNSFVFTGKSTLVESAITRAKDLQMQYLEANTKEAAKEDDAIDELNVMWRPLDQGIYKINVDGACEGEKMRVGLGVVIRDWKGEFVAGYSQRLPGNSSPETTETLAVLRGLSLARDLSINHIVIESDALNIVKAINTNDEDFSAVGISTENNKRLMGGFQSEYCVHVARGKTKLAHAFAKHALHIDGEALWSEGCPLWVFHILCNDVLPSHLI